jgi:ribosome-associated protein
MPDKLSRGAKEPREVYIRKEPIELGQFLKLAGAVLTGGEAKELIQNGLVSINGETEKRRSRLIHSGDTVVVRNQDYYKLSGTSRSGSGNRGPS